VSDHRQGENRICKKCKKQLRNSFFQSLKLPLGLLLIQIM
jgi:hypothetical protein